MRLPIGHVTRTGHARHNARLNSPLNFHRLVIDRWPALEDNFHVHRMMLGLCLAPRSLKGQEAEARADQGRLYAAVGGLEEFGNPPKNLARQ